jgi:hypothetical protein
MKKDATAKDVVVLLCEMLNLPSKAHYGVVELKKSMESIVDDDTLIVKRMAEWVLEASSKDTELPYFRLRRVLYPTIEEIKSDLSIEELNFLFIQVWIPSLVHPFHITSIQLLSIQRIHPSIHIYTHIYMYVCMGWD